MLNIFYRNPRLLVLVIFLVLTAGLSALRIMPRQEDPRITPRGAQILTRFPGASPERVETLVTEKIEESLQEIDEVRYINSTSRAGMSVILVMLKDEVGRGDVDEIWSRVRDRIADAAPSLPAGAATSVFDDRVMAGAFTMIAALTWDLDSPVAHGVLNRLSEQLEDRLRLLANTEYTKRFGANAEQVLIEVDADRLAAHALTAADLAAALERSDVKLPAGRMQGESDDLLIEVEGEFKSLDRLRGIPIVFGERNATLRLGDIATVRKTITDPASELAIIGGKQAIVVSARILPYRRTEHWSAAARAVIDGFRETLPAGIGLRVIFDQNSYTEARLEHLGRNLMFSAAFVLLTILFMMGWRSAILVGSALPLTTLAVLASMNFFGIPIHQMSITGLIIALGLLIDNSIIMVDEVEALIGDGLSPADAITGAVRRLSVPLLSSTLTTIFAFAPVALLPGGAGEFVGPISLTVILALICSLAISLTIVPALKGFMHGVGRSVDEGRGWWIHGFSSEALLDGYHRALGFVFSRPMIGVVLAPVLPLAGFLLLPTLEEQFFPPSERDQFQIQFRLPPQSSFEHTRRKIMETRELILAHPEVADAHFTIGTSAPRFYYNMLSGDENTASFGQALIQLHSSEHTAETVNDLQEQLDAAFPESQTIVTLFEQGPPFDAPIEVRVKGPDLDVLAELGDRLRGVMAGLPHVVQTRATLASARPKLLLRIDEEEARLAGLSNDAVAAQLNAGLEGIVGGSMIEATEELPIRVRVASADRQDVARVASLDLRAPGSMNRPGLPGNWIPLSALGEMELAPQRASIPHRDGERINSVKAFLTAGVLPASVFTLLEEKLAAGALELPPGYALEVGGESAERNEAVGSLMSSVGLLLVLMIATLVLSLGSFRLAAVIGGVGFLSIGFGLFALRLFSFPFGFMAIVGTMGLVGIAINDAIVVLSALIQDPECELGDVDAVKRVVVRSTRHVLATTFTTAAGFTPLVLGGGGMWPPPAVAIAGGVAGATLLALLFVPSAFVIIRRRRTVRPRAGHTPTLASQPIS